jgi:RNA recognition motif-containing protein
MKLFVGGLSYNVLDDDLRGAFEAFGQVAAASVVKDKESGQSRGFGFVEMPDICEAEDAVAGMNGKALMGRTITVNEARPASVERRCGDVRPGDRRGKGRY